MKEKNTCVKSVRIFTADWKDRFKIQSDQFGFFGVCIDGATATYVYS
jgi:hypothetical protein